MSYTDDDNTDFYYLSIASDTAATSVTHYYPSNYPSSNATRGDNFSLDLSYMHVTPKPKRVKSKWLDKKLRKLGR